jgi:hypothetical protein
MIIPLCMHQYLVCGQGKKVSIQGYVVLHQTGNICLFISASLHSSSASRNEHRPPNLGDHRRKGDGIKEQSCIPKSIDSVLA